MTWRELRTVAVHALADAGIGPADAEARFMIERASGYDAGEWLDIAEATPTERAEQSLREMVRRRVAGEPLQYVLGGWDFRGLDLFVDRRVLIPRPETEYVVEVALEEAARSGLRRTRRRLSLVESGAVAPVVDIGTGSGAIAIALAAELPDVEVWATDVSDDALDRGAGERGRLRGDARSSRRARANGSTRCPRLSAALYASSSRIRRTSPSTRSRSCRKRSRSTNRGSPSFRDLRGPKRSSACSSSRPTGSRLMPRSCARSHRTRPTSMSEYARALGYPDVLVRDDLTGRARVLVGAHAVGSWSWLPTTSSTSTGCSSASANGPTP